jgi:spore germination protein YaaH
MISRKSLFIIIYTLIFLMIVSVTPQPYFKEIPTVEAKINTYNMTYVYYGETPELIQRVDATKGALQAISPGYLELTSDGSLSISESLDAAFIKAMHDRNISVIPYLGNEWNRALAEKALQNREALTTQIANAIEKYKLDGINVDLENITETSRDALIDFVKLLRAKLPKDKELSIAVPANPYGLTSGFEGAYNLKALAAVCDYIMLMAYDEHYPGDPVSGPVASLPFVEKSVKYALTQIPSSQLVLGIPFYGRFWNGQPSYNGTGITNELAATLAAKYGGVETYDEKNQSIKSEFTIQANDPRTKVLGQSLPNGSYTLWYENEKSIKAKLELVQKYNLKGTGSWSLNQATANTWSYYGIWSNGHYYADLQNHWSQQEAIKVANKGWMIGVSAAQFAPDRPLTRAQAATILVRALGSKSGTTQQINAPNAIFNDVSTEHWAYADITSLVEKGIITGISNNSFAPDAPMTREQMSVLLTRALKFETSPESHPYFSDVEMNRWSYSAIAILSANRVIYGYHDGSFHPMDRISRAEMAALLFRIQDQFVSTSTR